MRVITGSARGMVLRTLEGENVRPTTDKVKEAVFSAIQFEIEGRRILDLFAGSGQLGIEALSRGAESCTFVDADKNAVKIVKGRSKLEASGGITIERLPSIGKIGVDFVSAGALTHSVKSSDISLDIFSTIFSLSSHYSYVGTLDGVLHFSATVQFSSFFICPIFHLHNLYQPVFKSASSFFF